MVTMDVKQFRESGLLEIYLIGGCTEEQIAIVEKALDDYPELQEDINEISSALFTYASIQKKAPSAGLKDKILKEANPDRAIKESTNGSKSDAKVDPENPSPTRSGLSPLTWLLGLVSLASLAFALFQNSNHNREAAEWRQERILCDSIQQSQQLEFALLEDLRDADNQFINIAPTENNQNIALTLVINETNKKNYLKVSNLPNLSSDQSYQLWSLKPEQDPIPLTVFQGDEGVYIPVDFEENTPTYAVTIEPRGGSESPTLSNLLGTWSVEG